ncbi:phage holin family protein [Rufibacter latericius]|uniref:Phage holin family protein n=1 Tax=Rufibacter latericius TaxID=2487040 RepID=A0A3M9N0M9_9BACT|nr:phage holin family protein [Rufibacter latericius]RNI30693.1 phage holin family protein [Rufibacter latericius]
MDFLINLLVSAGVLMLLSYLMPQVHIKSFWTALWVAFLVGILNATIGLLLRFPLNLVTLFFLQFVVRLVVTAIIIKLVDKLLKNFEVRGFWPALVIAIALAVASTLLESNDEEYDSAEYQQSSLVSAAPKPLLS